MSNNMTETNNMTDTNNPASTVPIEVAGAPHESTLRTIFMGPNGIRAGWRILIFIPMFILFALGISRTLLLIPGFAAWAKTQSPAALSGTFQIVTEGFQVVALLLAAWIMSKIEKRTFTDYSLPFSEAFGKKFWLGIPFGFLSLSLLLAAIAAAQGFSVAGLEDHGGDILKYGVLFGIVFVLVGIFEEFSFRGYMQSTLESGIGFWPAAVLLSIGFGALHLGNPGEAKIGAFMAGSFGLVAAFALRRTGNLWFPIGMHAAWDWGETYFYGVPDSGLVATGRLLSSSSHGPAWLSGGTVGPEGSYLVFPVLLLIVLVIHLCYPAKKEAQAGTV
jgi:uncharacterized protein